MQDSMPQFPLNILILSSDPRDERRLRLGQEHRDLKRAIRLTQYASSLNVTDEPSCRYSDITAALDHNKPNVLHFSGHGDSDVLCFEDEFGDSEAVEKQHLAELLSYYKAHLKLVILNACFSFEQGQAFANAVGLAIVAKGSILDKDAIHFTREFYTALGTGHMTYATAFGRAKAALKMRSSNRMQVYLLQRNTPGVRNAPASRDVGQTNLGMIQPQPSNNVMSSPSPITPMPGLLANVAANGAALKDAVSSSGTRRVVIPRIIEFVKAIDLAKQRLGMAEGAGFGPIVIALCNNNMRQCEVSDSHWNETCEALFANMRQLISLGRDSSQGVSFGGFDINDLKHLY